MVAVTVTKNDGSIKGYLQMVTRKLIGEKEEIFYLKLADLEYREITIG